MNQRAQVIAQTLAERTQKCAAQEAAARKDFADADVRARARASGHTYVALFVNSETSQKLVGRRVNLNWFRTVEGASLYAKSGNLEIIALEKL
jgi:hypothetical protein